MARVPIIGFPESPHCPICAKPMVNVGLDFKAPPTKSVEQWEVAKHLFNLGFAYHTCGCQGPGYRPTRWRDVRSSFDAITSILTVPDPKANPSRNGSERSVVNL